MVAWGSDDSLKSIFLLRNILKDLGRIASMRGQIPVVVTLADREGKTGN